MKEAIGELNMSVVVVMIIAFLSLFFFTIVWPTIRNNVSADTRCDAAICPTSERIGNGLVKCYYRDKAGNQHDITCTWKG